MKLNRLKLRPSKTTRGKQLQRVKRHNSKKDNRKKRQNGHGLPSRCPGLNHLLQPKSRMQVIRLHLGRLKSRMLGLRLLHRTNRVTETTMAQVELRVLVPSSTHTISSNPTAQQRQRKRRKTSSQGSSNSNSNSKL